MHRRTMLLCSLFVCAVGCSKAKKPRRGAGLPGGKRPKGPQTMGNMLVDAWKQDLGDKSAEKRIRAARELGNMGPAAKATLPALQKMAGDKNPQVAAAAKAAITAIGKPK